MDALTTNYKLGSLFDGSGGFPLAGALCGIEPRWASEVEPYPIAVTRTRFPNMKHLGDISKINGAEIEPVDVITFGSPCQDLSVAGKRAGLKHEANGDEETTRSGLFMEAVRIIKEMREATNGEYPRFALWENVPGAFSSNKGEDFRIVLEELVKIVEPSATMPEVPKNGWAYADSYVGDGWSLAYRVFDAQYWGVPQRRRRIHLVADFRGERAREVLFEREGVRGYFAEGRTPWQGTPADAQGGAGANDRERENSGAGRGRQLDDVNDSNCLTPWDVQSRQIYTPDGPWFTLYAGEGGGRGYVAIPYTLKMRAGCEGGGKGALIQEDKSATLATSNDQVLFQPLSIENHPADSRVNIDESGKVQTLTSRMGTGGGNVPMVMEPQLFENHSQDTRYKGPLDVAQTVAATYGMGGNNQPFVVEVSAGFKPNQGSKAMGIGYEEEVSPTLLAGQEPGVVYCLQGNGIDRADTAGCNGKGWKENTCYTLNTIDRPAVVYALDRASFNQGKNAKFDFEISDKGVTSPLVASGPSAVSYVGTSHADDVVRMDNVTAPLQARDYKGGKLVQVYYIVRRLTPTECARLQGFADRWGDIEPKKDFTDEEYVFWLEVRNTHAAINDKKVQDYTKKQMLTWYNKLQTDSSEYKMWGNGIALPPALYCMQGIVDALNIEEVDAWML